MHGVTMKIKTVTGDLEERKVSFLRFIQANRWLLGIRNVSLTVYVSTQNATPLDFQRKGTAEEEREEEWGGGGLTIEGKRKREAESRQNGG